MLSTFKYTVLALLRDRTLMIWSLAFPLVLSLIFMGMFSGLQKSLEINPMDLGVVKDAQFEKAIGLDLMIEGISEGDDPLVHAETYQNEGDAARAVRAGTIAGYVAVDDAGDPVLNVSPKQNGSLQSSVVVTVLDEYLTVRNEYLQAIADDPSVAYGAVLSTAFANNAVSTEELQITSNPPDSSARYYFALLGMTAGLGVMLSNEAVKRTLPAASPLGARRTVAGVPRWNVLAGTLLAAWACEFVCLMIAYAFIAGVVGVNFGNALGWGVCALVVSSLACCALGCVFGTFKPVNSGMISAIICLASLFTGLYGPASQQLCDMLQTQVPVLIYANPLWQITNCFYSLLYYDTLTVFGQSCLVLIAMAGAFFAVASALMRRRNYASR